MPRYNNTCNKTLSALQERCSCTISSPHMGLRGCITLRMGHGLRVITAATSMTSRAPIFVTNRARRVVTHQIRNQVYVVSTPFPSLWWLCYDCSIILETFSSSRVYLCVTRQNLQQNLVTKSCNIGACKRDIRIRSNPSGQRLF